jgi:hypothetical protein
LNILEKSLLSVIQRHEALRTVIKNDLNNIPYQLVLNDIQDIDEDLLDTMFDFPSEYLTTAKAKLQEGDEITSSDELANKEVSNYISKNNLGSVKDIQRLINISQGEGRKITSKATLSTGESLYFETIYGPDLNLISIKQVNNPYDFPDKNPRKTKSKIPGITLKVDKSDGEINMSSESGEYTGFIEDDGTISFSVVYDDMDEEFDDNNWKDILGNNHAFVKIANTIPTDIEAIADYVQITVKADDLI